MTTTTDEHTMTRFIYKTAKRAAPVLTVIYRAMQIAWFAWKHH